MSNVQFASAKIREMRADASLPAKFKRMLEGYPLKDMFGGKTVAIKMHLGGHYGYTTIPPLFVRMLVQEIKDAGGNPFITDGSGAIPGAIARGYTQEVLRAPLVAAAGLNEKYFVTVPIDYLSFKEAHMCGEIYNADAMIVYSHGKGHGYCGWGGAIKNIAMGNFTCKTRGAIHALADTEFEWNSELCTHCYLCRDNCPTGALTFREDGSLNIFVHHCRYCMHCVRTCPVGAITLREEGVVQFQTGMALATKACLDTFEEGRVLYINHLTNVTPLCDCWGFTTPSMVPDVGIFSGTDIVSVEQASIDSIKIENFIDGMLPHPLVMRDDIDGHLLQKIHGKDPYLQCAETAKLGLGSQEYDLTEVE
ncbi:MAG: DUF362 domain-containing protein [Armatimonadota bacterium]